MKGFRHLKKSPWDSIHVLHLFAIDGNNLPQAAPSGASFVFCKLRLRSRGSF